MNWTGSSPLRCGISQWTIEQKTPGVALGRVVCKLTYDAKGAHRHFVATSFSPEQVSAGKLHQDIYCPRGEMENRIKEHQLDLFSDRTSTQ